MSQEPWAGAGRTPSTRQSRLLAMPWLHGAEARTVGLSPGWLGQPSLRVITPATLVMTSVVTGLSGNCGKDGGASTGSPPSVASEQLILVNNCAPVSGPDWPRRGTVFLTLAAVIQALRCAWVNVRQRAATLPKARRTPISGPPCGG